MMRTLIMLAMMTAVAGKPTLLVTSPKSTCIELEAPRDEVIEVTYEAPDLPQGDDSKKPPVYMSVSMKPAQRVLDLANHESPVTTRLKPTTQRLEHPEGTLKHRVEIDGTANICIRASGASEESPMLFAIHLAKKSGEEASLSKEEAENHLSNMATELKRIEQAVEKVLKEADFAKERDQVFHKQAEEMHSATVFWPIVQVCVLLMTGFTQASHIVRFFKTRRII